MEEKQDLVHITARVDRSFRSEAVIASRRLGTTVSDLIVEALEAAIAKANTRASA